MIFDSHCHLDASDFDADRPQVMARAVAKGVTSFLIPATDLASSVKTCDLVDSLACDYDVYGAVGVHPHEANRFDDEVATAIDGLAGHPRIVAVGETGLDYHYTFSPRELQLASLRSHVHLALRRDLPLILHCRNAEADLLSLLEQEEAPRCGGVIHCYTGDLSTARHLLAMGFYLGFTGIVTFRNADALREVVRQAPLDRLLLETDCPYLAPIPYRGKRNEPSYLPGVCTTIAGIHGVEPELIARITRENACRCFRLGQDA